MAVAGGDSSAGSVQDYHVYSNGVVGVFLDDAIGVYRVSFVGDPYRDRLATSTSDGSPCH